MHTLELLLPPEVAFDELARYEAILAQAGLAARRGRFYSPAKTLH